MAVVVFLQEYEDVLSVYRNLQFFTRTAPDPRPIVSPLLCNDIYVKSTTTKTLQLVKIYIYIYICIHKHSIIYSYKRSLTNTQLQILLPICTLFFSISYREE